MYTELHQAEKSNCHLHLTGALLPGELREVASIADVDTAPYEPLEDRLAFDDPAIWALAKEITSTEVGLRESIDRVVGRERYANVTYIELTLNPSGMLRRGLGVDTIAAILHQSADGAADNGARVRFKFGVNRKDGPQSVDDVVSAYDACDPAIRSAIDLNGDELAYPTSEFVDAFRRIVRRGIPVTIHAGEFPNLTQSLQDALRIGPQRIGHGVAAMNDPELMSMLKSQDVSVEIAPTSNVLRGAVTHIKEHHTRVLVDSGVKVVLGNDDPGFFNSTMSEELQALCESGMSLNDVLELNRRANNHALDF